jgi:hypothetical protein
MFGIVIRMFGIREGLLQGHFILEKLRTSPILEVGGGAGIVLILGGLASGAAAPIDWGSVGFGVLAPGELLRKVSFSTMLVLLGGVTLMTSLIIGFLALPTQTERSRNRLRPATASP